MESKSFFFVAQLMLDDTVIGFLSGGGDSPNLS